MTHATTGQGVVRAPGGPELSRERGLERPLGGDGTCRGLLHKSCRLFSQNTVTETVVTLYAHSGSESISMSPVCNSSWFQERYRKVGDIAVMRRRVTKEINFHVGTPVFPCMSQCHEYIS